LCFCVGCHVYFKSDMKLTFANRITVARILIVPFFISTVLYYTPDQDYLRFVALAMFMVAMITDVIDGYIARSRFEKTRAGAILDPLADKVLLISAFVCLYKVSALFETVQFPMWLVVSVISRDVILILGITIIYGVQGNLVIEPTRWGKATTFFESLCIFGILLQVAVSSYLWHVTLILVVISGIDYIRKGIKLLNNGDHTA